ncbi:MAG: hypothetical protein JWP20_1385 [Roseomonas sp.]|nr:hypothetical protein [Roseomonas sp.]
MTRPGRRALPLLVLLGLGACNSVGGIVGGVTGATAGVATANPAVGYAVGIGVKAAVDATVHYVMRELKQGEQDAIAAAAGGMAVGETADWVIAHNLPFGYEDAKGTVQVTRAIDSPLAQCREVLITVAEDKASQYIIATTCRQASGWKWASAEPAVERWGALQ